MGEILPHQPFNIGEKARLKGDLLTSQDQAHELAADLSRFGAAAYASEVAASQVMGTPTTIEVSDPIDRKLHKRRLTFDEDGIRWQTPEEIVEAAQAVAGIKEDMARFQAGGPEAQRELKSYIRERVEPERIGESRINEAMLLNMADLPPFLKDDRTKLASTHDIALDRMDLRTWMRHASPEVRLNFAQWYSGRLEEVADPDKRAELVGRLKHEYVGHVRKAMADGWIDPKHDAALTKRIDGVNVLYFSPFGNVSTEFAGFKHQGHNLLAFPTIVSDRIVNHEFGHEFGGLTMDAAKKYFEQRFGAPRIKESMRPVRGLYTMLNEGFDDHMTEALLGGSPHIISPADRAKAGIPATLQDNSLYDQYREVFGEVAGEADMKSIVDTMVAHDFEAFAELVNSTAKFDVMGEAFSEVERFMKYVEENPKTASFNDLPGHLSAFLRERRRERHLELAEDAAV